MKAIPVNCPKCGWEGATAGGVCMWGCDFDNPGEKTGAGRKKEWEDHIDDIVWRHLEEVMLKGRK